jgi:hypothetical protein
MRAALPNSAFAMIDTRRQPGGSLSGMRIISRARNASVYSANHGAFAPPALVVAANLTTDPCRRELGIVPSNLRRISDREDFERFQRRS